VPPRRRWISILALAPILAVAGAGIATAYTPTIIKESFLLPVELNGGFKPTRLPKKKLAPIHLDFEEKINAAIGSDPPPLRELVLEIDKNVAFDTKGLAVCRPRPIDLLVEPRDLCKEARVGKGEMEFEIEFAETLPFALKSHVVAFNGGKAAGVRTIFAVGYLSNPISATVVIRIEVTKVDHGRYGSKLVAAIPQVAGGSAWMKKFRLELFRRFAYKRKRQSFVKARCLDGKLQVGWKAALADGTVSDGSFKRPCTPQP